MYLNMSRNIVIGPPGTGKTTFLKNKVDAIIKEGKARPNEIGYFSFTVKAAEEIRNRVARESWSENELKKIMLKLVGSTEIKINLSCILIMM